MSAIPEWLVPQLEQLALNMTDVKGLEADREALLATLERSRYAASPLAIPQRHSGMPISVLSARGIISVPTSTFYFNSKDQPTSDEIQYFVRSEGAKTLVFVGKAPRDEVIHTLINQGVVIYELPKMNLDDVHPMANMVICNYSNSSPNRPQDNWTVMKAESFVDWLW